MTPAEIIEALTDYGFADIDAVRKLEKIQSAIWDIEGRKPWPFLEASKLLSFAGGSATPSNPATDLRAVRRLRDLTTGRLLTYMRLEDAEDYMGNQLTTAGDPLLWYSEGGQLKVYPLPTASTERVSLKYYRFSAKITAESAETAILIPARKHEVILLGSAKRLYDMEDDFELGREMERLYEKQIQEMVEELFMSQFDLPEYIHVYDPDDWDDENF